MRGVFDPRQLSHAPLRELHNGEWMPYSEVSRRALTILDGLGPLEAAVDHGSEPLIAVHDPDYVAFL
jgi:hypothetical protein